MDGKFDALQDMDALVCRRTLTGHRHSVLCITGMDLLGQNHDWQEGNGSVNGTDGRPAPPLLVSSTILSCVGRMPEALYHGYCRMSRSNEALSSHDWCNILYGCIAEIFMSKIPHQVISTLAMLLMTD